MKLAIGTTFDYQIQIATQFMEISNAGFDAVSLGANILHSNCLERTGQQQLLQSRQEYSLALDSLHAPFVDKYDISSSKPESRMAAVCRICKVMASAIELNIDTVILHLNSWDSIEDTQDYESLAFSLDALIESAENMGIKLAAENLPDKKSLTFLKNALQEFDSENFGFCYDSSHDQLSADPNYQILEQYADRLFALHLSDNDGKEDRHWLPFTGIVDWQRVTAILKNSGFDQNLLLEVENRERIDTTQFLMSAYDAADQIKEMILK